MVDRASKVRPLGIIRVVLRQAAADFGREWGKAGKKPDYGAPVLLSCLPGGHTVR
tara:strand:- start:13147 stop:13311 length:165 start_codon:yes stop_codon:yes gene_type:complete